MPPNGRLSPLAPGGVVRLGLPPTYSYPHPHRPLTFTHTFLASHLSHQVAWFGHPDTTGVASIDYFVTSDVETLPLDPDPTSAAAATAAGRRKKHGGGKRSQGSVKGSARDGAAGGDGPAAAEATRAREVRPA